MNMSNYFTKHHTMKHHQTWHPKYLHLVHLASNIHHHANHRGVVIPMISPHRQQANWHDKDTQNTTVTHTEHASVVQMHQQNTCNCRMHATHASHEVEMESLYRFTNKPTQKLSRPKPYYSLVLLCIGYLFPY